MREHDDDIEDIDPPDVGLVSDQQIQDALDILLKPYEPVESDREAEKRFTTNEIIQALEQHYGVPQGDPSFYEKKAGLMVVDKMNKLGFKYINTGGLQLQWVMKIRMSS